MEDRVRSAGPEKLAEALKWFDPALRKQIEEKIGATAEAMAAGQGGENILKLMQERSARMAAVSAQAKARTSLSLDKAWHGVHYVLCGKAEPGASLLSQAVMGGADLGEDDEGFSGYGPARLFTPAQVAAISKELSRPQLEQEAAARFDAAAMTRLKIYPGFAASDASWVMDAFRSLRDFYADAAAKGNGIVTCLE
jgi:Domain of unknown function (DUF1877)